MNSTVKRFLITIGIIASAGLVFGIIGMTTANPSQETIEQIETKTKTETRKEIISYETTTVEDGNLEYGKTVVRTAGVDGEKTYTYSVKYENNKEVSRELVKEEVTKEPVTKVIAKGTKIVWHCVDATSYDRNANNDNKCTSSTGEVRYVDDCTAMRLDPNYTPSRRGAKRYNPCS